MCGHGTLAITKVAFETGLVKKEGAVNSLTISVPAGLIYAKAYMARNGIVAKTTFRNVPSFAYLRDQEVSVSGIGVQVKFDIAFGGAFYAIVDAHHLGLTLDADSYSQIIRLGRAIKQQIITSPDIEIQHPFEEDLSSLFGVVFTSPAHDSKNHSRNVNVFEDGAVDRSSCGSGVSARAALHFAKGELKLGDEINIESIVGSVMSVKVVEEVKFGGFDAVVPEVGGEASITGRHDFYFHKDDIFKEGFKLR